jgi:hypothetical protein
MTKSNSKRFVRAAWSLLFFQCVASAGAVAVTGWAVFHVQNLAAVQGAAAPVAVEASAPAATTEAAPATDAAALPQAADAAAPAAAPAATAPAVTAAVVIAACPRMQRFWRVSAQAEWCDTGLEVREGQTILVRFGEGQWSNSGPPAFRQEGTRGELRGVWVERAPLGALIGRVGGSAFPISARQSIVSPANGHLLLAMNDAQGAYADNQGWLDVYVAAQ